MDPQLSVYIVEDHDMIRRLLGRLIEQTPGLLLLGACDSAEEALGRFETERPDLVLVDISLPGMDGIELIGAIKERWPQILLLAVSGHDDTLYAKAAFRAGARGYVMKGRLIKVREAIDHVIQGRQYIGESLQDLDGSLH